MPKLFLSNPKKLNGTKELLLHVVHVICGAYVLAHFVRRYTLFFFEYRSSPDMGFDKLESSSPIFWIIFLPHLVLQLSGFGFQLPSKRHPDGNRIWSEYRWHALTFFCRCTALMFLAWMSKQREQATVWHEFSQEYAPLVAAAIFFLNMVCADYITSVFKARGESSPTIRGLKGPQGLKYLMSAAQFHANVNCLLTRDKMCVQFAALVVVQSSAFGMTLRRKGLINHEQGLFLYSMVLCFGMIVIGRDLLDRGTLLFGLAMGNVAALARIDFDLNKYVLWGLVAFVCLPGMEVYARHSLLSIILFSGSTMQLLLHVWFRRQLDCRKSA